MNNTLSNLRVNPKIAFYILGTRIKGCYQVKGVADVKASGKEYDEMKAKINKNTRPSRHARSLL